MSDVTTTLPRRVAVVDGSGGAQGAAGLLAADLRAALGVYAHLAGTEPPELTDVPAGAEAVLLVVGADEAAAFGPAAGVRLYAVVLGRAWEGDEAWRALEGLGRTCASGGGHWMGGLAVGGSSLVERTTRSPRMGWLRRRLSEAVDRVVIALLAGMPAPQELVRPPVPRGIWRLLRLDA